MEANQSYTVKALLMLIDGQKLSLIEDAKNSNQYFNKLKNRGIELDEVSVPNIHNCQNHLERSLKQDEENIERAKQYLKRLQAMKPKTDEAKNGNF